MIPTKKMLEIIGSYGLEFVADHSAPSYTDKWRRLLLKRHCGTAPIYVDCHIRNPTSIPGRFSGVVKVEVRGKTWRVADGGLDTIDPEAALSTMLDVASKSDVWADMLVTAKTYRLEIEGPPGSRDTIEAFALELDAVYARYGFKAADPMRAERDDADA